MGTKLSRKDFIKTVAGVTAAASDASAFQGAVPANRPASSNPEKNIKWAYMDHWSVITPRGRSSPYLSLKYMDRYIRQLAVLGFTGFDTFNFRLGLLAGMFGSLKGFEKFLQDHGFEKFTGVFAAYPDTGKARAIHDRANHDAIFAECESAMKACDGLSVENFVVMPANTYWQTEPVTDEKIKIMADLWNRVGRMTLDQHGVKTSCHHEFWCAIRTPNEIAKFYQWTDPRYVYYWCDTAQTVIAGQDPTQLYNKYHDRTAGFHFKDTHDIDTKGEYRMRPEPEPKQNSLGVTSDRPNAITPGHSANNITQWFDTTAFRAQPFGTEGNEGHNILTGPHGQKVDLSVFKDFAIRESTTLQFRAESFNLTNTPSFGLPGSTITAFDANGMPTQAGNFGRITTMSRVYTPREIQFALKLIF